MPLFKVLLRQAHDTSWVNRKRWSNAFYVDVANPAQAAAYISGLWQSVLRNAADTSVFAYEVYAADMTVGTDVYHTVAIPPGFQRGLRVAGNNEKYLTKACIAVTLQAASGRPSRKFWRFGLHESDTANGVSVSDAVATLITENFNEVLQEFSTPLRDPDGQELLAVQKLKLTTREFGKTAGSDVPQPPAQA